MFEFIGLIISLIASLVTIYLGLVSLWRYLEENPPIVKEIWKSNQGIITARYGNLLKIAFSSRLKKKGAKIVVVPVDTKFTMKFVQLGEIGFVIHPSSIHGQWIQKMRAIYGEKTFEEILDYRFKKYLNDDDLQKDKDGNVLNRFQIGSILPWLDERDNTTFLLVAVGDFDDVTNRPLTTPDDINKCLESILKFYCQRKTDDVYLPLIGAGMTRVKTPQEAYDVLTNFFEDKKNRQDICSRFTVVVYHKNKKEVRLFTK